VVKAPFYYQLSILLVRVFRERFRDKVTTGLRFGAQVAIALLMGWLYFNLSNDQASIQNRVGLLFFVAVQQAFSVSGTTVNRFPLEKPIFYRENSGGYYGSTAYYLSRAFGETPFTILFALIFGVIVYWMTGLQSSASKFFIFEGFVAMLALCAEGMGLFLGAAAGSVIIANLMTPLMIILLLLTAGLYVNLSRIPWALRWISFVNPVRYAYSGIAINEFTGLALTCTSAEESLTGGSCSTTNGSQVLARYNLTEFTIAENFILLAGCFVLGRLMAYAALRLRKPRTLKIP